MVEGVGVLEVFVVVFEDDLNMFKVIVEILDIVCKLNVVMDVGE